MADKSLKLLDELQKAKEEQSRNKNIYPAFDELTLIALERRHLELPEYSNVIIEAADNEGGFHLQNNVRLLKLGEVAFDSEEDIHLPGVESAITAMRGRGYSLLFVVQGDATRTSVYLGVSKFSPDAGDINATRDGYEAVWKANFPGTALKNVNSDDAEEISYKLSLCNEIGVLTGIPSLKREEKAGVFVQGLERMIRAMRGKTYTWLTIADPIPQDDIRNALDQCRALQSDIHQLVKTDISKAVSDGKTVMLGIFGMGGKGETKGTAKTDNETATSGTSKAQTLSENLTKGTNKTDSDTTAGTVGVHAGVMGFGGSVSATKAKTKSVGTSESSTSGISDTAGTMESLAKGWANTLSNAVSSQLGGGGFASFGMTWTKTTTVGQEFLNRKAEYAEEVLKAYEKRFQEGTALGMWNLGHYFCSENPDTYNHGIGVVTSLFSGMGSHYEPPRTIKMPKDFTNILRRFQNVYLRFGNAEAEGGFQDHPLGVFFNGPATPVNTKELAVATPLAVRDVDGVSVFKRPSFGLNADNRLEGAKSLTVGTILDKGNETRQSYRIALENLPKHLAVFGLTGSGKTNTVKNLLTQLWKVHKIPFLVIEPAKAEYRSLAEAPEIRDDLLVVSAGADNTGVCPLRLNPFDFEPGADNDANRVHILTHIDRLKATFNASFPMYASMPYILEEAVLEVYKERGWNLGRSSNRHCDIYADPEVFRDYIPTLLDLYGKVEMITRKKGYAAEQQMNIEAALKARLSSLMVGSKGTMLNCVRSIPAEDLFNRPCVIELENLGDDDEKAFVMGLLVSKLYEYRKATFRKSRDEATSRPESSLKHILVIEEAHRLLGNVSENTQNTEIANPKGKAVAAFVDMLSEIRAFGQAVAVVDQLPSRVSPNIVKGTGSKIIHRILAKDDRESVGETLGLDEKQIADLSLLRVGECVAGQDGDRKAFMCKVSCNKTHETAEGGGIPPATEKYKTEHAALFEDKTDGVDLEDALFNEDLHKAMLAVAVGEDPAALLPQIKPTEWRTSVPASRSAPTSRWREIYWTNICAEIRAFYGGSFGAFLAMKEAGLAMLLVEVDGAHPRAPQTEKFRAAFKAYIESTKTFLYDFSPDGGIVGAAYEQLLMRHDVMVKLNAAFDKIGAPADGKTKLALALRKAYPILLPRDTQVTEPIRAVIAGEIIRRVALKNPTDEIVRAAVADGKEAGNAN